MSTMQQTESNVQAHPSRRVSPTVGWALLAGGVAFFIGGSMHPGDDPPGLTLKEHLHLLYTDLAWSAPGHRVPPGTRRPARAAGVAHRCHADYGLLNTWSGAGGRPRQGRRTKLLGSASDLA